MNRIDETFQRLKSEKKKAFIAYITAGDPDLKRTKEIIQALPEAGVDVIELGVPFSDPLADGPTIQAASQRALKKGVDIPQILRMVKSVRSKVTTPLILMTYYNPVFHYGEERFIQDAVSHGVDGVIIPDLPPEEAGTFIREARKRDLATIFFLSPTTRPERIRKVIAASTGFIYFVSLTGVTGARQSISPVIDATLKRVKKLTSQPVCVGFGISSASQVRQFSRMADGVIVGSAIVDFVHQHAGEKGFISKLKNFVQSLRK